jgi:hypothetical protein
MSSYQFSLTVKKSTLIVTFCLLLLIHDANAALRHHRKLVNDPVDAIPEQFIVELHPQYNPRDTATGLLNAMQNGNSPNKAEVMYVYDYIFNGFAMKQFPEAKLNGFLNNPQVKQVWRVSTSSACDM